MLDVASFGVSGVEQEKQRSGRRKIDRSISVEKVCETIHQKISDRQEIAKLCSSLHSFAVSLFAPIP